MTKHYYYYYYYYYINELKQNQMGEAFGAQRRKKKCTQYFERKL